MFALGLKPYRGLLGALALLLMCLATVPAQAADLRADSWGHASGSIGPRFASDDLDFGLGLNLGYTLDQGVYLGGLFDYFFADDFEGAGVQVDVDAWFLMFEGGYDFGVADGLLMRPTFALGVVGVSGETCITGAGCVDDTNSEMEAGIGGHIAYDVGGMTVGGEIRVVFAEADAVWMGFNLGTSF